MLSTQSLEMTIRIAAKIFSTKALKSPDTERTIQILHQTIVSYSNQKNGNDTVTAIDIKQCLEYLHKEHESMNKCEFDELSKMTNCVFAELEKSDLYSHEDYIQQIAAESVIELICPACVSTSPEMKSCSEPLVTQNKDQMNSNRVTPSDASQSVQSSQSSDSSVSLMGRPLRSAHELCNQLSQDFCSQLSVSNCGDDTSSIVVKTRKRKLVTVDGPANKRLKTTDKCSPKHEIVIGNFNK